VADGVAAPQEASHVPGDGVLRLEYAGRVEPNRGIENLLEAVDLVRKDGIAVRLRIAGSGQLHYERLIRHQIETLGLGSTVELCGHLREKSKADFFKCMDLAVIPSQREIGGTVAGEALAHVVPVVVSTATPWSRVAEVGCGAWVDSETGTRARAIRDLSRAPLRQMGERGRQWMVAEFAWEQIAQQMYRGYRSLLRGKSSVVAATKKGTSFEPSPYTSRPN